MPCYLVDSALGNLADRSFCTCVISSSVPARRSDVSADRRLFVILQPFGVSLFNPLSGEPEGRDAGCVACSVSQTGGPCGARPMCPVGWPVVRPCTLLYIMSQQNRRVKPSFALQNNTLHQGAVRFLSKNVQNACICRGLLVLRTVRFVISYCRIYACADAWEI